MDEEKLKHMEFIQNIITRMNSNSFQIKGWCITIVSAVLALYASTQKAQFILIGIFPTVLFWFLDSYYLTQERKFRGLYNEIAGITESKNDIKLFEMRPDLYCGGKYCFWSVFFSKTIFWLYLSVIAILLGLYYVFK
ncbi:hypothetical protein HNP89_000943 [Methanococcus maripaludis]|uniref:Uncharacterized protein n=1 Tax=Methanococcus maripaludis TaxID=39152 RepID=A0A7J9P4J2_METMI|nr:hypothetical protein [Methanococcus maripaludis]MBA2852986.1 hypothetical protein [Methanococcus maripaludis]